MSTSHLEKVISACRLHTVLKVSLRGDTLLITPQGDISGYQHTFYESEFSRINKILGRGDFKKAIVELSRARYFSSAMIGAFMTLKKTMGPDGQFVLAEPSYDMSKILHSMHFDDVIPIYDSVELAVKDIATVTTWERVKPRPVVLNSSVFVLCLLAGILILTQTNWLSPFLGTSEAREYQVNMQILEEINILRRAGTLDQKWNDLRKTLEPRLKKSVNSTYRTSGGSPARMQIHEATVSLWQLRRETTVPDDDRLYQVVLEMENAAKAIQQEQRITLNVPKLVNYDPTHPQLTPAFEQIQLVEGTQSAEFSSEE